MICNNCKKEVETGTIICPYCGCLTEENSNNDGVDTIEKTAYSNNKREYKDADNKSYGFGIFVSIVVLIAGIIFFFYSAQTASNVHYLIICISKGIGILTSSIGLISLSYFVEKSKNE